MANEGRVHNNFVAGLVENNPLAIGGTTLTSGGLANLQAIGASSHVAITIDPDGIAGDPEIVWVTSHTASAGSATIVRAREGTVAREHMRDTPWVHTATVRDYDNTLNTVSTSGASLQLNGDDIQDVTLTANTIYTFPAADANVPKSFTLIQRQDATGGRTPTFPAAVLWNGGTTPTWSNGANAVDTATFFTVDGGTTWFGYVSGLDMS